MFRRSVVLMMIVRSSVGFYCTHMTHIFCLWMILVGLIGVKKDYSDVTPASQQCCDAEDHNDINCPSRGLSSLPIQYNRSVDKIALIIIDAMRIDFISETSMPYTSDLLGRSYASLFKVNVRSPTVTLPRIKAIVSGEISTYWDMIQNFNSKEMTHDNLIWHIVRDTNQSIVFYGDETWLALFPDEFTRSEGTNSFFVSDFFEVDDNVTRHLRTELNGKADWDMMILHYLGLDHIGHVHGPKSTLVPAKLREMDSVIEKVYTYLSSLGGRSYLFVCGDHGMANIGGHGGNSYHETTTPLIVLSTVEMQNPSQKNWRNVDEVSWIQQTDIAPTLSALWGLTFPAGSTGEIIWPIFDHLSKLEKLYLANYNARQLQKFAEDEQFSSEFQEIAAHHSSYIATDMDNDEEGDEILTSYKNLNSRMSQFASDQSGHQNVFQMISGILLSLQNSVILFSGNSTPVHFLELFVSIFIASLFYTEWISGVTGILVQLVILLRAFTRLIYLRHQLKHHHKTQKAKSPGSLPWIESMHYLLPLSYFSSSFIEEEHYLCYYFWATGIICLFFQFEIPRMDQSKQRTLCTKGVLSDFHGDRFFVGTKSPRRRIREFCYILFMLFVHRIASVWNQTGDKWSHLDDIVDYLKDSKLLTHAIILAVLTICWIRRQERSIIYVSMLVLVAYLKTNTGIVPPDIEKLLPHPVHLLVILAVLYFVLHFKGRETPVFVFTNIFIVFVAVLQKGENIPLVALVLVQCKTFGAILSQNLWQRRRQCLWILVIWFSRAAFFYQGNSNSITTIDVNAGYIGLSSYNEALVGFLIFCNTFSLPSLVLLDLSPIWKNWTYNASFRTDDDPVGFIVTVAKSNAVTVGVYSIAVFILRHHLFIWSVFTPKLFYVMGFAIYYAVISTIYTLTNYSEIKKIL